jgi:hypothetical protein
MIGLGVGHSLMVYCCEAGGHQPSDNIPVEPHVLPPHLNGPNRAVRRTARCADQACEAPNRALIGASSDDRRRALIGTA